MAEESSQEGAAADAGGLIENIKDQMTEYMSNPAMLIDVAQSLVLALLIYFIGKRLARLVSDLSGKGMTRAGNETILVNFIKNIIYYVIFAAVIVMALGQLGVQTTSLIAVMGAAGLAIGLALKDSLSNLASGVMLVLTRPFSKGDFVEVAGASGTVTEIKLFSTYLLSPDNKRLVIPNGQITAEVITNYTSEGRRRIDLVIGVDYGDDIKQAKKILDETVNQHELVLSDPAPVIQLGELGDSSVNFKVRPWVKTEDYWKVHGELMEQIKINIEAGGCSFPFPQTDVHLHQAQEG